MMRKLLGCLSYFRAREAGSVYFKISMVIILMCAMLFLLNACSSGGSSPTGGGTSFSISSQATVDIHLTGCQVTPNILTTGKAANATVAGSSCELAIALASGSVCTASIEKNSLITNSVLTAFNEHNCLTHLHLAASVGSDNTQLIIMNNALPANTFYIRNVISGANSTLKVTGPGCVKDTTVATSSQPVKLPFDAGSSGSCAATFSFGQQKGCSVLFSNFNLTTTTIDKDIINCNGFKLWMGGTAQAHSLNQGIEFSGGPSYSGPSSFFAVPATSAGDCGIPPDILAIENTLVGQFTKANFPYIALNVQDAPGNRAAIPDVTKPCVGYTGLCDVGMYNTGLNCGRWISAKLHNGKTKSFLVNDSCSDNNELCRDSRYHVDLHEGYLNSIGIKTSNYGNPVVSWKFILAPKYTGHFHVHLRPKGFNQWRGLLISHLKNGIHALDYCYNSDISKCVWTPQARESTNGQLFSIPNPSNADVSQPLHLRVEDVDNQIGSTPFICTIVESQFPAQATTDWTKVACQ